MVERLCTRYGTPLTPEPTPAALPAPEGGGGAAAAPLALHAFPGLEQLASAAEEDLRADGFGYRAKYIVGSAAQLLAKPGGGEAWLHALREAPFGGEGRRRSKRFLIAEPPQDTTQQTRAMSVPDS
jgi:hypothetical protein